MARYCRILYSEHVVRVMKEAESAISHHPHGDREQGLSEVKFAEHVCLQLLASNIRETNTSSMTDR